MESNTPLTPSQALKLYSGKSIGEMIVFFAGIALVGYLSTILIFLLLIGLDNGFANARQEICDTLMSNMFLAIDGGIVTSLLSLMTYDKEFPGGKYYRSVRGGYDTYKKMRLGNLITAIAVIFLFVGTICAINAIFPILVYGTATCISMLIFLLLGIGIGNLLSMIPSGAIRGGVSVITFFALDMIGIISVYASEGKLGIVQIIAGVIALVLIPVSYKLMIINYKKNRWDS